MRVNQLLLGVLVPVVSTYPARPLLAQWCRSSWSSFSVGLQNSYFTLATDRHTVQWGGHVSPPGYITYGVSFLQPKPRPVKVECDAAALDAIHQVQELFHPSMPNASGGATGANTGVGPFIAGLSSTAASATSGDVVVGFIDRGASTTYHAFRWSEATGISDLGTLDPANDANRTSMATGLNADGTVIVGFSQIGAGTTQHAFRWTSAGMADLGAPAGTTRDSRALAVNAAGDVIVGDGVFVDPNSFTGFRTGAFRWTAAGGFQNLGALEPGFFSIATDVSSDGTVIVGQGGMQVIVGGSSINGSRAFRWTNAAGLQPIGPLTGHTHAIATGVSDNGNVVVGISSAGPLTYNTVLGPGAGTAFRWTAAGGIQDLRQLLISAGLSLTDITLVNATGISADGQWIFGNAITSATPHGETRPFMAKYCDAAIGGSCTPLIVDPTPGFNLTTLTPTTASVVAGGSITSTLTVTPSGGFSQAVTFSCSGLPAESNCSFSPPAVTPNGTVAVNTTLTITTTAPRVGALVTPLTTVVFAGLLLLGGCLASARSRIPGLRPVGASVLVFVALGACGGGGDGGTDPPPQPTGGTPAGTYQVVVTAASGSGASATSKALTYTLTVTR